MEQLLKNLRTFFDPLFDPEDGYSEVLDVDCTRKTIVIDGVEYAFALVPVDSGTGQFIYPFYAD